MFLLLAAAAALAEPIPPQYDVRPMRYDEQPQQYLPDSKRRQGPVAIVAYTVTGVLGTVATGLGAVVLYNTLRGSEYSAGPPPAPSPTVQFH